MYMAGTCLASLAVLSGCNSTGAATATDESAGAGATAEAKAGSPNAWPSSWPAPKPTPAPTATPTPAPTPKPTVTSTPAPDGTLTGTAALDAEEQAFLGLINAYRATVGAPALTVSVQLTQAADWLSVDMASRNYFSHTDRLGRSFSSRIAAFGYAASYTIGENIAAGNATAQATFAQWKSSSGHNANMLSASYRVIGIARAYDASSSYKWYWTTDFGGAAK